MAIFALGPDEPRIDPDAFIHPTATIIGAVEIGPGSSVWPSAVLRGDQGEIRIGARTSVQDGSVIHVAPDRATIVGDDAVIGHLVHLEGCVIEDGALVGNGAVVLPGAVVRSGAIVGSNAVVPEGREVPPGSLALGVPARVREGAARQELIVDAANEYVARAERYRRELRRLD
ncbi:MAG: gamma carbonic anhydrase family protein [Actinomycetota bacterium]